MQATLEEHDYNVDTANNAETGLYKLKARKPDLLILDIMMATDLEGQRLTHKIKHDPENKELPILVITGMLDKMGVNIRDAFEDVENLPSVVMLDKPIETEELLTTMKKLIAGTLES